MTDISTRIANLSPAKQALLKLQMQQQKGLISFVSSFHKGTSFTSDSHSSKLSALELSSAYLQFQKWSKKSDNNHLLRIEKHLVHKDYEQNVLIARIEKLYDDVIVGEATQDISHPFFYEHPKDHVPGLYILEVTRQFVTALSHLHYKVPLSTSFILNEMHTKFHQFAETSQPLFVATKISGKVYTDDRITKMNGDVLLIQNGEVIAEVKGNFQIFEANSYNNIRRKSFS